MKYISVVALLMLSATQVDAMKVKFFDMPSEENAEIITEANKMNQDDTAIMKTIDENIA